MDSGGPAPEPTAREGAPVPPELGLEMPVQDLHRQPGRALRPEGGGPQAWTTRAVLALLTVAVSAALIHEMWIVLGVGSFSWVELVMLVLFAINITWVVFGTVSSVIGFVRGPSRRPPDLTERLYSRTALLLPAYNEHPARVVGAAAAMLGALADRGFGDRFDLFILSDSNTVGPWLAEQALIDAARQDPRLADRLFYRHRLKNAARKAGNIEDWVERWGADYDFMLVLDADSLMEADTVVELARRMEAEPKLGLLQSVPRLIGAETPLARVQQFSARVYGPILAHGLAGWFGDAGNYWGHNAIIRTRAFASYAGLPLLRGNPPFGGLILSHDFVEAALIRRGGWGVKMADDLEGSYEAPPPNIPELAQRDRRWCQGNLQHTRLLPTTGLHPLSRLHLAMGVLSYLASPLWFLFLLAGMALALHAHLVPPDYFLQDWSLFPTWPQIDAERAMLLFGLCMAVLFLPKILGLMDFLVHPVSQGMRLKTVAGFLVEILLTALVAPILMLTQTSAVIEILTGRDSGWKTQSRDADGLPWGDLWRFHKRNVFMGLALALAAGSISWRLLAWMSPAIVSLLLAVPISRFAASGRAGRWLAARGVLVVPEERRPPEVSRTADAETLRFAAIEPPADLAELLADPAALARHAAWLDPGTARRPGEADAWLASARLKLADGVGPAGLNPKEAYAVLTSAEPMAELARARQSSPGGLRQAAG